MARPPRKSNGRSGRLHQNQPPALLVGREPDPPPSLRPDDIVDCFRLSRAANGLFGLTLQFRDGRLRRIRVGRAYLRPLQRALAAAVRRWLGHGHPVGAEAAAPACRCGEALAETILQGVHVHGLQDAVVVTLGCSDGPLNAAFDMFRARALETELRRLAVLTPAAG